jgi:hypothetical protein
MRLTALFGFGWIGLDWIGSRWALYRLTQALSTEAYASSRNARMNAAATCGTIAFPYPFNLIFRASPVESAYATSTGQSGTTPRGIP